MRSVLKRLGAGLGASKLLAIGQWDQKDHSKLLITNQKGVISIINANNGVEIDTLKLDELSVPPIPVDGNLLFLTAKGSLLAF